MKLKKGCKRLCKKALLTSGSLRRATHIAKERVAILKYHSVQEKPELFDDSIGVSIIQPLRVFKRQMEIIAKEYNPVTMDDILFFLRDEKELPKRAVAITFDDGYLDNFEIAGPVLGHFGIRATFYITAGAIKPGAVPWFIRVRHAIWRTQKEVVLYPPDGRPLSIRSREDKIKAMRHSSRMCAKLIGDSLEEGIRDIELALDVEPFSLKDGFMMSWNDVRMLSQDGHMIGSHTVNHLNIAHLRREDIRREVEESKRIIEGKIGEQVIHFSYPNSALTPHFSGETMKSIGDVGYKTAVVSTSGPVCKGDNPLLLERVTPATEEDQFMWNLECTLLGRHV